jgi:hypothetical protein
MKKYIYGLILIIILNACATRSTHSKIEITGTENTNQNTAPKNNKISTITWRSHAHNNTASNYLDYTKNNKKVFLPTNVNDMLKVNNNQTITSIPVILIDKNNTEHAYYTIKTGEEITLYDYNNNVANQVPNITIKTNPLVTSTQPALFNLNNATYIIVPGINKSHIIDLANLKIIATLDYNNEDTGQRIFVPETQNTEKKDIYIQGISNVYYFTVSINNQNQLNIDLITSKDLNTSIPSKKLLPIISNKTNIFFESGNTKICSLSKNDNNINCTTDLTEEETISNLIINNNTLYYTAIKPNYFLLHTNQDLFKKDSLQYNTNDLITQTSKTIDSDDETEYNNIDQFKKICDNYNAATTDKERIKNCIKTYTTTLYKWNNQKENIENNYTKSASDKINVFYLGQTNHTALISTRVDSTETDLYYASNMGYSLKDDRIHSDSFTALQVQSKQNSNDSNTYYYSYNLENNVYGLVSQTNNSLFEETEAESKNKDDNQNTFNNLTIQISKTIDRAITDSNNTTFAIRSYRKDLNAIHFNNMLIIQNKLQVDTPWLKMIITDPQISTKQTFQSIWIYNKENNADSEYKNFVTDKLKEEEKYDICLGKTSDTCKKSIIETTETIKGLSIGNGTVYIITDKALYTNSN